MHTLCISVKSFLQLQQHSFNTKGVTGSRKFSYMKLFKAKQREMLPVCCKNGGHYYQKMVDFSVNLVKATFSILRTRASGTPFRKVGLPSVLDCHPCCRLSADAAYHSAKGKASLIIKPKVAQPVRDDPSPSWNGGWALHPLQFEN